jgi:integrase
VASAYRYSWTRADGSTGEGYRAQWTGVDGRTKTKRGFDRKGDALDYAEDREVEVRHGVTLAGERPSGKTTVEAWTKTWLADRHVRDTTHDAYRYTLKRVTDTFGGRTLASLRTSELRAWRKGLEGSLAESTASQTAAVFAMVLHDAVLDGLLDKSPMPSTRGGGRVQRVVDPEQILTIEHVRAWDAALPEWAQGMAEIAAITGLRQGELLGLLAEHVDFLRKRIRVMQQLQRGKLTDPKTSAGVRTVPLPQRAVDLLAAHIAAYPSPDGEPIFLTQRGKRWSRTGFNSAWTKARDEARVKVKGKEYPLPEWAHWHALRDVCAAALIRDGNDMKTVMAIMGHSSPDETYKTYARVWPDALDQATKRLNKRWSAK